MRRLNKFNNYTSELSPLLLADDLPFVTTGDITPTILADSMITNHTRSLVSTSCQTLRGMRDLDLDPEPPTRSAVTSSYFRRCGATGCPRL